MNSKNHTHACPTRFTRACISAQFGVSDARLSVAHIPTSAQFTPHSLCPSHSVCKSRAVWTAIYSLVRRRLGAYWSIVPTSDSRLAVQRTDRGGTLADKRAAQPLRLVAHVLSSQHLQYYLQLKGPCLPSTLHCLLRFGHSLYMSSWNSYKRYSISSPDAATRSSPSTSTTSELPPDEGGAQAAVAPVPSASRRRKKRYTRSRSGCLTCRKRKVKCDEVS